MVLRTRQELRCEPSRRRGPDKGGRPPERTKGRWWGFTAAVATVPGSWTVTPPRGLGLGRVDSVQGRLTDLLFRFLCSSKACTSA